MQLPLSIGPLPPWLVISGLLGVINAAACFTLVGRDVWHLAWYALVGLLAASLGQVVAMATPFPAPLLIGDVNVLATSLAACALVVMARLRGL